MGTAVAVLHQLQHRWLACCAASMASGHWMSNEALSVLILQLVVVLATPHCVATPYCRQLSIYDSARKWRKILKKRSMHLYELKMWSLYYQAMMLTTSSTSAIDVTTYIIDVIWVTSPESASWRPRISVILCIIVCNIVLHDFTHSRHRIKHINYYGRNH